MKIKVTLSDGDKLLSCKSSNTKIATVSSKGVITGKKKGKAIITYTSKNGAKAKLTVNVQNGKVKTKKIIITNVKSNKITLDKGKTYQLKTELTPITSQEKLTYISSNKKVITVNKKGSIKAIKKGKTFITIKSGKKSLKIKVTVK